MLQLRKYLALMCGVLLVGCNVGMAPDGMTREQAKAALDKLSPQDQIKYVSTSPMPDEQKKKRYAEIEAKTGVKASDVLGGGFNR